MARLHFVSRQAGTLHAFELFVRELAAQKQWDPASKLYHLGTESTVPGARYISSFDDFLNEASTDIDCLITGTSLSSQEDSRFWSWARQNHIPCLAFHDQWVNTRERFLEAEQLPDGVLVVDDLAHQIFSETDIDVPAYTVGSPLWDQLRPIISARQSRIRPDLLVFATEPSSLASFRDEFGYEDLDSLKLCILCCERFFGGSPFTPNLAIKLHPVDKKSRIERALESWNLGNTGLDITITSESKYSLMETASYFFGMQSMLLYEASLAGLPVISFQPNPRKRNLVMDRPGIEVIHKLADTESAFKRALSNRQLLPTQTALNRLLEVLNSEFKLQ